LVWKAGTSEYSGQQPHYAASEEKTLARRSRQTHSPAFWAKQSINRQAIMMGISRGSICYKPCPVSDGDLKLMRPGSTSCTWNSRLGLGPVILLLDGAEFRIELP
jgi:hypothetical protein